MTFAWVLVIYSLLTGEVFIEEKGFTSEKHCKTREAIWRDAIPTQYWGTSIEAVCVKSNQVIKPRHKGPRTEFEL